MDIYFLSYEGQSPVPTVTLYTEDYVTDYTTTVTAIGGNVYKAVPETIPDGYYWMEIALTGGGYQTYAVKVDGTDNPIVADTIEKLKFDFDNAGGGGGGATVIVDPNIVLRSRTRLLRNSLYLFNDETSTISLTAEDLSEEDWAGLTMEFCIEKKDRTDLFFVGGLTTETNALTIEIDPIPEQLSADLPLSWSLREETSKRVLATGPVSLRYAPIED